MGDRARGSTQSAGKPISIYDHPLTSTQPGHPSVARHNKYRTRQRAVMLGGWGVKANTVRIAYVGGR